MILVHPPADMPKLKSVAYARVSTHGQKGDLERQLGRLLSHASANGIGIDASATEVGSGLNGHRPKLARILADPSVGVILVEHRDRLARFGTEYVEAALKAHGRKVVVADPSEMEDDLVQDMVDVLTSFYARLYGRRAAKNRALKALEAASHG